MRKKLMALLMLSLLTISWAMYNVGDTVLPADNMSWTIDGPVGHSEIGQSSTIFDKIAQYKAVFIFQGQSW